MSCTCTETSKGVVTVIEQGPTGATGPQGEQGDQGIQGIQGTTPGDSFEALQGADYVLTDSFAVITGLSITVSDNTVLYFCTYSGTLEITNDPFADVELKILVDGSDVPGSFRKLGGAATSGPGFPLETNLSAGSEGRSIEGTITVVARLVSMTIPGATFKEGSFHILEIDKQ